MQKYKDLFIDLDDTLWDIHQNSKECLLEIYNDYGYKEYYASFDDYYNVYMPSNIHLWGLYRKGEINKDELIVERFLAPVREFGIDDTNYAKKLSDDFLERTTYKTKLIDGSMELLEYLKPKYNMHILSNGFREVQYKKIENSGLKPYFDKIILSDDAGINKPHIDFFNYALEKTNATRSETIMIGDSWDADILGAYNSNIHQLWFNPEELKPSGFKPTYSVKSLWEIKGIL
jgi:putative hydrolase of the HAD superfamily